MYYSGNFRGDDMPTIFKEQCVISLQNTLQCLHKKPTELGRDDCYFNSHWLSESLVGRVFVTFTEFIGWNLNLAFFFLPEIVNMNQYNAVLTGSFICPWKYKYPVHFAKINSVKLKTSCLSLVYIMFPQVVIGNPNHFRESVLLNRSF